MYENATVEPATNKLGELKKEIKAAKKESEKVIQRGQKIIQKFEDERDGVDSLERRFNIFTTNVEILQSALYANIPRVDVKRRFNDMRDKPALVAADIIKRMIDTDLNRQDNDFDQTMMDCVFDRLVPGGGFAWLRYEPTIEVVEIDDPAGGDPIQQENVVDHYVTIEHVFWEDFLWSPCRSWNDCRWVARRVYMDRDALIKRFGQEIGSQIPLDYNPEEGKDSQSRSKNEPKETCVKQAVIYELWEKKTRRVYWFSNAWDKICDERPDPLKLDSFWPCPRPLFARKTTSRFMYVADYYILQDQYEQLNRLSDRLSLLTDACKVAGAYDRGQTNLPDILKGGENKLVPVDNWAMFAEKGGMKGVIDWLPLDTIILAIEKLSMRAEAVKQNIYELSGISDIMRGSTNPYEGVGSQQIKAQFASARLQRMQNEISRFAGEILTIKAEIMLRHFPIDFMVEKSNIQTTIKPEDMQVLQDAVQLIADEERFGWRVEIQPDSMAQIDYNQEKAQKTEFIQSAAGFLNNAVPAMANAPQIAPFMAELLKFGISGFKNTQNLEVVLDKYIDQMVQQAQQPKGPSPEQQKAQVEMQKAQQELQLKGQEHQMNMQAMVRKHQLEMQHQTEKHQAELAMASQENKMLLALEQQRAASDAQLKEMSARLDAIVKLFSAQTDNEIAKKKAEQQPKTSGE